MNNIMALCDIFHCKLNDLVHEDIADFDSLDEEIIMSAVKFKKEKQQKMKDGNYSVSGIRRPNPYGLFDFILDYIKAFRAFICKYK